ncbi:MAG: ribonuclease Y [Spirochaetia bacterium]
MSTFMVFMLFLTGLVLGWVIKWVYGRYQLTSLERMAEGLRANAVRDAETLKKEILLEAREQRENERRQQERELRERWNELKRSEGRLITKEDNLDKKILGLETRASVLANSEKEVEEQGLLLAEKMKHLHSELERVAGLTVDQAKQFLIDQMRDEAQRDARVISEKIEQEARESANKRAREILVQSIQRLTAETNSDVTMTSVSLPNEEMKGRIIGREGRNIRTLETLTGVDVVIDDTPEAVVISCFDPVRKAIAKETLERLMADGRIHPTRIEEMVQKVTKEFEKRIYEEGEKAVFALGLPNIRPEGIRALGRLRYRTSYGQNVLAHSIEVAHLAGSIAAEIGANREIAKRAGLFHDVGKAIEADGDANHAEIGAELCKSIGESVPVVHAVLAHHNDIEPETVEAVIIQIADAISAARPGARRETLDSYIKRLESIEKIATSFDGVERAFAMQAGRDLRIIVNNTTINEEQMKTMGKDIAQRIESEVQYPGRIRVTLVRETRVVEYAR